MLFVCCFCFRAVDGIRGLVGSLCLGDVGMREVWGCGGECVWGRGWVGVGGGEGVCVCVCVCVCACVRVCACALSLACMCESTSAYEFADALLRANKRERASVSLILVSVPTRPTASSGTVDC